MEERAQERPRELPGLTISYDGDDDYSATEELERVDWEAVRADPRARFEVLSVRGLEVRVNRYKHMTHDWNKTVFEVRGYTRREESVEALTRLFRTKVFVTHVAIKTIQDVRRLDMFQGIVSMRGSAELELSLISMIPQRIKDALLRALETRNLRIAVYGHVQADHELNVWAWGLGRPLTVMLPGYSNLQSGDYSHVAAVIRLFREHAGPLCDRLEMEPLFGLALPLSMDPNGMGCPRAADLVPFVRELMLFAGQATYVSCIFTTLPTRSYAINLSYGMRVVRTLNGVFERWSLPYVVREIADGGKYELTLRDWRARAGLASLVSDRSLPLGASPALRAMARAGTGKIERRIMAYIAHADENLDQALAEEIGRELA